MSLPDPEKSAAVIIGVASYAKNSRYPSLPAVKNNVEDLARVLTDPRTGHLTRDRCLVLLNRTHPMRIVKELRREAAKATDTFTIYFSGHGERGEDGSLYLILKNGNEEALPFTAIDFDHIRGVMKDCPARRRIVILDCCFSGNAIGHFMSSEEQAVASQTQISGTYTLTSTEQNKSSIAPEGERYTAFTGELISLLEDGLPDRGEYITLREMFPVLRERLAASNRPKPQQRSTEQVVDLALTRNAAYRGAKFDTPHDAYRSGPNAGHDGAWRSGIDKRAGAVLTSSAPPLPSPYARGAAGIPALLAWGLLAILMAVNDWFSIVYSVLLVAGVLGLALEARGASGSEAKRAGIPIIVTESLAYGWFAIISFSHSHVGLAFFNVMALLLYVSGAINRARHRYDTAIFVEHRINEEKKPDYQRISEYLAKSSVAARLRTERWLGESSPRAVFDALSYIPSARFMQMRGDDTSEDTSTSLNMRQPDYAVVCGKRVVAIYFVSWPAGAYQREAGLTKDLRRNRTPYEAGRKELSEITDSVKALRAKVQSAEITGLAIVTPQATKAKPSRKPHLQDSPAPTVQISDQNLYSGDVVIATEENAADAVGPFLAEDAYAINLDIANPLLEYASAEARVDAGLTRHGARRLTA